MKSKLVVILSTLIMALAMMAQNATQTTPAPSGESAKTSSCCDHGKDGKMSCCGKDGGCCKDGKCAMMSKDGKEAMASHEHQMSGDDKSGMKCPMMAKDGKMSCCGEDCCGGKCDMAKDGKGKSCCDGTKCQRKQAS